MKTKSHNKTQTTENVVANVKYVVSNIRLVGKLAGVFPSHNFIPNLKKKKENKRKLKKNAEL